MQKAWIADQVRNDKDNTRRRQSAVMGLSCRDSKDKRKGREAALANQAKPDYFTCLPISPAISNMDTCALPKISFSFASALTMRLLTESCSLFFLM
jgi:hypothetical protein